MDTALIFDSIIEKIKQYDRIIIMRHVHPDGDALGAAKGLKYIIKASFPQKEVYAVGDDSSDYLAFLGDDDHIDAEMYNDSLAIVVDAATEDRISDMHFTSCKEIIRIDHHIDEKPFGNISWIDEERSSASEMIAELCFTRSDELVMTKDAAYVLYLGIVTDSGRFRFSSTSPTTLKLASSLLEMGIDTENLYAHLYLDEFEILKCKAFIYNSMRMTENGVVYYYITQSTIKRLGITTEQASSMVSLMDCIKGSLIWLAFIEHPDKTIHVRLRSRFVAVNELASDYNGGGHAFASGATVLSDKEMKSLINEADTIIKEYKQNNSDWM